MKRAEGNYHNKRMFEFGERIGWELQNVDEKLINDFCSRIGVKKRVLKVWLHNNNNNKKNHQPTTDTVPEGAIIHNQPTTDTVPEGAIIHNQPTIDILPEDAIHKILSNVNYMEASRMIILSRAWLKAWLTHPNLLFIACSGAEERAEWSSTRGKIDMDIVDKIMKRYRDKEIPIDKFELSIDIWKPTRYIFIRIDKWLDIALQNGVTELVYRNLGYFSSFNVFKILTATHLRELVLESCNLVYFSSLPTSYEGNNCLSLRKLCLDGVTLDDNMLQGLVNNYPLIDNLIILYCSGWKKFEVRNLQNIRSLQIAIEKNQSVEIEAPTLQYLSYFSYCLDELDIVEFPNLESLEISGSFSSTRFKIGTSESLRVLKINNLRINDRQKIEVYAPNLVSLEYAGYYLPQLKLAKVSSKFNNLIFNCKENSLDNKWFCRWMEFLSNSKFLSNWSQVSIQVSVYIYRCGEINMEHLNRHYGVAATPKVDVLDVIIEPRDDPPTFVDALLWCFRPRKLHISSSFKMIIYLIHRLLYIKNLSDENEEPQLVQLKQVKAYKFDGKNESWHPVNLKSMKLKTGGDPEKFYFLLDW